MFSTSKIHTSQFTTGTNFYARWCHLVEERKIKWHTHPRTRETLIFVLWFLFIVQTEKEMGGGGDSLCPCYLNVYLVSLFLTKGSAEARGLGTHPSQLLTWARTNASWSVKYRLLCDLWPVDSHFLLPPLSTLHSTDLWPSVTPITISVKTRSTIYIFFKSLPLLFFMHLVFLAHLVHRHTHTSPFVCSSMVTSMVICRTRAHMLSYRPWGEVSQWPQRLMQRSVWGYYIARATEAGVIPRSNYIPGQ